MDCKYTTINTCELKGSTFRSHLLNFGDFDISEYTFSAGFSNSLGQKLNDVDLEKVGNSVILPLTSIENRSGRFRSDVWMVTEGNKDLAVRFDISISDTDCGCTDDTTHDITITFQELVIPVTVTQSVVNINYLDYESLTPEQQAELVGPQGPQGIQGVQGPQGLQGPAGEKGEKGVKGDAGIANPVFNPANNTEAPTMKAVADYVAVETVISTVQLFDKNNYNKDTSFTSANNDAALVGGAVTNWINIPDNVTLLSWLGLGTSAARRIAWKDGLDGTGNLVIVNTITTSAGTNTKPTGSKSFRFFFQRPEDGDTSGSFMLNFGGPLPYESYRVVKSFGGNSIGLPKPNTIKSAYAVLSGTSPTVNASKWYKKTPVVADIAMKGNTGLGYDLKRNLFVVAEYNTTISSKILIFRNSDLVEGAVSTPYRTIDLSTILDHIQGVTWDFVDDTYLALGTKKGAVTGTTNSIVVKVSPIGTVLDIFELGDNLNTQVGMIDVLIDGNIIIKPNGGNDAYIYSRSYNLLFRKTLLGEEGIAVNKFTGDIWCADSNFTVKKYDKNFVELATYTFNTYNNESAGSNVEGMAILPDGSLVISADAFLHGGTALGNALFFFDFETTVNKRRYFYLPNGIGEYKDLKGEYITEIIKPAAAVTSVVVESENVNKKFYRSSTTIVALAAASYSSTLTTNNYFQTKITI